MTFGLPGVGKTNVLFKLAHFYNQNNIAPNVTLISANDFTLGQDAICEKFCNIVKIPFISCKNSKDFNYESDKTYFIDFGAKQSDQEKIFEFFDSGDFNFFPIFIIPAAMSFSSLKQHVGMKYQKLNSFYIILTFCDLASNKAKKFYEKFLEKNCNLVLGYNSSGYLHKGLEVTPVLDRLKLKYTKNNF